MGGKGGGSAVHITDIFLKICQNRQFSLFLYFTGLFRDFTVYIFIGLFSILQFIKQWLYILQANIFYSFTD